MNKTKPTKLKCVSALIIFAFALIRPAMGQKTAPALNSLHTDASSDVLLQAMSDELERSKSQLKMENVPAPYYIEYRLSDSDEYDAEAAFGALRLDQRVHARSVRVVVRVGDYKQDSYYGPGVGAVSLAPIDNDPMALRWQLWIATDQAYKAASEALAMKNAALRQYTSGQPFNDFARVPALQSIEPVARLDFDPSPWKQMIEKSSALFRRDPKIESLSAGIRFRAVNQYFVNSEGTVTRSGYTVYSLNLAGLTQADDGMRLGRSPDYTAGTLKELPTPQQFQADALKMLETLKNLREAPVVDEDYRGPVLFSADAASELFNGMVGRNLLGIRPRPGDSARTTGDYASKFKSRVLPAFLSVSDDPTQQSFGGKTLVGAYAADDEGVRASKVSTIQDGMLVNYLLGRDPIRDFPDSNGHGRAGPGQLASPSIGVLIVASKQPSSPAELKQKLIEICRQEGRPFGYYAETLGGSSYQPLLLYRVYEKDGHEELVRGAVFDELDTRTLRNDLVAAGNDPLVSNREGAVPTTVIAPSILIDDLEVKRTDTDNAKLPEYPPPALN
jgi:predicted Zn-dependent protease